MATRLSRRIVATALLGSTLGTGTALGAVSAFAHSATVNCPTGSGGLCEGHEHDDDFVGTPNYDNIPGSAGWDFADGYGTGDDIDGGGGVDIIFGWGGQDDVRGGDGGDYMIVAGTEYGVMGGDGQDRVDGNQGDDYLYGGADIDDLYGGADIDLCDGGPGDDNFFGCEFRR